MGGCNARCGHFEESENVGDAVAHGGRPAVNPHAEEKQGVHERPRGEQEVIDNKHRGHDEQDGPRVMRGGFE